MTIENETFNDWLYLSQTELDPDNLTENDIAMLYGRWKAHEAKNLSNMNIANLCEEGNMRIGEIIHIGGALASSGSLSDALERFIEEDIHCLDDNPFPIENEFHNKCDAELEEISAWLLDNQLLGFLVSIETPVIHPKNVSFTSDGNLACTYSWDLFWAKWFYAEKLEDAVAAGKAWTEQEHAVVIAKAITMRKNSLAQY